jgi:hypothetical protein
MGPRHACVCVAVVASLCSLAPAKGSDPPADVPFELVQDYLVVVKGSIGGLHGLNLLVDTGTIPSVLDQRIADKLRLRAVPSELVAFGQTVRVTSTSVTGLRVGAFEPGEVPARIGDLSYLRGSRVDAIIGLDVLARTTFAIDYEARALSFARPDREAASAPLQMVWPFVTVRLHAAGYPMQLLVDTGSRDLMLFKARMPTAWLPIPWKGDKFVQHASGAARLFRFDLVHATLGTKSWQRVAGFVLDAPTQRYPDGIHGVLGVRALGCTRVQFDFERAEISWRE